MENRQEKRRLSNRGRPRKRDSGQTKIRILDSAEELFARHGFQKVSLRAITTEAGVNVALINYHFGNKIALLNAVLERSAAPINNHRNRLLDACAERAKVTGRLDASEIMEAYTLPLLRSDAGDTSSTRMQHMIGLAYSDSSLETGRAIHRIFRDVARRFVDMLREACADLSPEEFHWRLVCFFGAITYLLAEPGRVRRLVGPEFDASDKGAAMAYALPFLATGMSAPPESKRGKAKPVRDTLMEAPS